MWLERVGFQTQHRQQARSIINNHEKKNNYINLFNSLVYTTFLFKVRTVRYFCFRR